MSYEICVMDPAFAPTLEAAYAAWNDDVYWASSLPDHQRPARKWEISDGLLKFNPEMLRMDTTSPDGGGWLDKIKGTPQEKRNYHVMSLMQGDFVTSFSVFDQAVEVDFAYDSPVEHAPAIAREAWRHLQALVDMGLTTVLDTERNALLDLNRGFETVLAAYIANLNHDTEVDPADVKAAREMNAAAAGPAAVEPPPRADEPFTGNVDGKKPWWKIW